MARSCPICGRGALNANIRSHSNIATARKRHVNLQTIYKDGRRIIACTSCIRRESKRLRDLSQQPTATKVAAPIAA